MIGWGAFVMPGTTFLPQAGVTCSLIAFGAATVAMCVVALNYYYLVRLHPQVGGLYPMVKMSFQQYVAFAASWAMGLAHLCCVSLNARAMARLMRAALEAVFDLHFHMFFLGTGIPLLEAAIVIAAIIVFAVFNARGIRQTAMIQTIGAIVLLVGVVIMLLFTAINIDPDVEIMEPLQAPGVSPAYGFMTVFVLTPLVYVGFDSLCSVSEELNFPLKRLGRILIISVLCGTFVYVANIFTTLFGVTEEYGSWPNYLQALKGLPGFKMYPVRMSAKNAMGTLGSAIFLISCFSATITSLVGFFTSISRMIYRMAQDGALPQKLAKVDPKRGTPVNAVRTVAVLAFLLYMALNAYNSIEELSAVATALGFGLCSLTALREAAQLRDRRHILLGAAGVLVCLFFLFFLLIPIRGLSDSISQQGTFFIAVWVFLGIAVYAFSKRQKIDL